MSVPMFSKIHGVGKRENSVSPAPNLIGPDANYIGKLTTNDLRKIPFPPPPPPRRLLIHVSSCEQTIE